MPALVKAALAAGLLAPAGLQAQIAREEIYELDLAELLEIEIAVSSVARRVQSLSETSAAIYVITEEDIRNSTALDLPDLLRTVPGIEVAQLDSSKWAISARGFNSRLASKLLLIIDGRTVYNSSFAAVLWESEDISLENIERIEVIRGPGATIWGANAVNGVVSITTKSSAAESGRALSLTAGNRYEHNAYVRQAGALGGATTFRVFGAVKSLADSPASGGGSALDGWRSRRLGFRIDSVLTLQDTLTLQGSWFDQDLSQQLPAVLTPGLKAFDLLTGSEQSGGNVVAKWQHDFRPGESLTAQFFYDLKEREELIYAESVSTYDVDLFYSNSLGRHDFTAGAGARFIDHDSTPTQAVSYQPEDELLEVYNLSLYDDYLLREGTVLGLGLKVEDNIYTGTEYQANLRLNQAMGARHNLWAAVARAVRTPSRAEKDSNVILGYLPPGSQPGQFLEAYLMTQPSEEFDIEKLESLELGWRWRGDAWFLDLATFYNRYSGLRNVRSGQPHCAPDPLCSPVSDYLKLPLILINSDEARSFGGEALVQWQYSEALTLEASYSYLDLDYDSGAPSLVTDDFSGLTPNRENPVSKAVLMADWNFAPGKTLNLAYRYVSRPGVLDIPSYHALDAKFAWRLSESLSLALIGRNLGAGDHREFHDPLTSPTTALSGGFHSHSLVEKTWHLGLNLDW